jgi:long-chain acyl-CoA synthetase
MAAATIGQVFEAQARKHGSRAFLKNKRDKVWHDHSWQEVSEAAGRLRGGFARLGIKPGDRVAIMADNCPECVIADQAALGMGAIVVPLFTTSAAEETQHVLNDSTSRIVCTYGESNIRKILALSSKLPVLETVVAMEPDAIEQNSAQTPPVKTLASVSTESVAGLFEGSSEDLATFIYTSGTTGPPKGVMLSHGNILSNCEGSLHALNLGEQDITLSHLPVAHSFERTAGHYAVMMAGATIAYAEGLTQIAQNLQEIRPTVVLTVPRLLEAIHSRVMRTVESSSALRQSLFHAAIAVGKRAAAYRHRDAMVPPQLAAPMALFRRLVFKRITSIFGDRLRYLISGSAPLPREIFEFLAAAEVPIVEGYGLTEAAPVVSCNLHGRTKMGTVGQPLINVKARVAEDGELLLYGPNVMKGYYKREDESREALDSDGWLHTGDIASIDKEGFITIRDRKKEIIVLSGGKNISPANLENKLVMDSYIAQACVVGDRRKHLAALLVPNFEVLNDYAKQNGLETSAPEKLVEDPKIRGLYQQRVRDFNKQVSDVEAITAFRLLARPFSQETSELTPTLKIRRRVIQHNYHEQVEAMYRA